MDEISRRIKNRSDLTYFLEADLRAAGLSSWTFMSRFIYPVVHFQRCLRKFELMYNRSPRWMRFYVLLRRFRLRRQAIRLGFTIPPNVFGPGLSIAHWGTIVVNDKARIGARCRIHPGTAIGERDGLAPTIGDDCYIGPGAKLFGPIRLGNNVKIGANAVVNKSFGDGAILVGVPAKDVSERTSP